MFTVLILYFILILTLSCEKPIHLSTTPFSIVQLGCLYKMVISINTRAPPPIFYWSLKVHWFILLLLLYFPVYDHVRDEFIINIRIQSKYFKVRIEVYWHDTRLLHSWSLYRMDPWCFPPKRCRHDSRAIDRILC